MSLRRRITLAAAFAVAAVAVALGATAYLLTRAQLTNQIHQELDSRAAAFIRPAGGPGVGPRKRKNPGPGQGAPGPAAGPGGQRSCGMAVDAPSAPPLGGAPGYEQTICPNGTVSSTGGGTPALPVTRAVRSLAQRGRGRFFFSAVARHVHVEILAIGTGGSGAVEIDLPLTGVDADLHALLLIDLVVVAIGIAVAGFAGRLIARAALSPIERFSSETERVTSALADPHRLQEGGPEELGRLALSFNQTLDALERSMRAQANLIADASHELRTPMAALRSNIQIFLEAERLPEAERLGLQETIVAELDELTQLVSDVLELARGTSPELRPEPFELDVVVREAVDRARRRAPDLRFVLDLEPTVVVGAAERVARAVTNVVDNARKWSPPTGEVAVTLHDGRLTVRDHGPGFEPEAVPHVFDRFYRADEARRMSGSGLGLAIVKQAAEAHGGSAEASNHPEGGAVLRVTFGTGVAPASSLDAGPDGAPAHTPSLHEPRES